MKDVYFSQVKCVEELRKKFKDLKLQNALNLKDLEHYQNNQAKAGELKEELEHVQIKMNCGKKDVETINKQVNFNNDTMDTSKLLFHIISIYNPNCGCRAGC